MFVCLSCCVDTAESELTMRVSGAGVVVWVANNLDYLIASHAPVPVYHRVGSRPVNSKLNAGSLCIHFCFLCEAGRAFQHCYFYVSFKTHSHAF